jgi:hypothetical protein
MPTPVCHVSVALGFEPTVAVATMSRSYPVSGLIQ